MRSRVVVRFTVVSEAPHQADAGQALPDEALVEVGPEVFVIEAVVGVDRACALLMRRSYHPHNTRATAPLVRAVCVPGPLRGRHGNVILCPGFFQLHATRSRVAGQTYGAYCVDMLVFGNARESS